jgi:TonB family protein
MFQVLVESRAPRSARPSWAALSTIGHAVNVAGAVALTAKQAGVTPADLQPEILHYAPVAPAQALPPAATRIPVDIAVPMALARPTFTIPDVIAPSSTALSDVLSRVSEELRTVAVGAPVGERRGGLSTGEVHTAAEVERIVVPLAGNPAPPYPRSLANAGIAGEVLVRFVVDTAGRVEPPSVEIIRASHGLFGDAVRGWLKQTRYTPARAGGRAVRQLVEQHVGFSLQR